MPLGSRRFNAAKKRAVSSQEILTAGRADGRLISRAGDFRIAAFPGEAHYVAHGYIQRLHELRQPIQFVLLLCLLVQAQICVYRFTSSRLPLVGLLYPVHLDPRLLLYSQPSHFLLHLQKAATRRGIRPYWTGTQMRGRSVERKTHGSCFIVYIIETERRYREFAAQPAPAKKLRSAGRKKALEPTAG